MIENNTCDRILDQGVLENVKGVVFVRTKGPCGRILDHGEVENVKRRLWGRKKRLRQDPRSRGGWLAGSIYPYVHKSMQINIIHMNRYES